MTNLGKLVVECRSINHRFSDINLKCPKRLGPLEARIKELVRAEVTRGRIDLSLRLDSTEEGKVQFDVNLPLAEQYLHALRTLKTTYQLQGEISIDLLAGIKDLIVVKEEEGDLEILWKEIQPILRNSLKDMDLMKRSEGESLGKDLGHRLNLISGVLEEIREQVPTSLKSYEERFKERLKLLLNGTEVDPLRFQQEVALMTERSDITEEIVRAESHLRQFWTLIGGQEPVGRKLDFLLQELHREVNTISSKANEARVSQKVVEVKSELEKIREQVQNIE